MNFAQLSPWQRLGVLRLNEEWRRGGRVTQAAVADAVGIPRQYLNEMERGKREVDAESAAKLAAYYEVPVGVLEGTEDLPPIVSGALVETAAQLEKLAARLRGRAGPASTPPGAAHLTDEPVSKPEEDPQR